MGNRPREAVSPDVLLGLDEEYASILALLDRAAAMQRIVTRVPQLTGVDVAWVGEPDGADRLVLHHTVNIVTEGVDGLVVPVGTGLGGQVFAQRRPLWVRDYCSAPDITHHFRAQAEAEGVMAMIAVPILHDGGLLGVLYGANRRLTDFGDRTAGALEQLATRTAAAQVVAERARHAAEVAVHEERRRVALELHDSVGAMLFTLRAGLQRLCDEPALDEDGPDTADRPGPARDRGKRGVARLAAGAECPAGAGRPLRRVARALPGIPGPHRRQHPGDHADRAAQSAAVPDRQHWRTPPGRLS